MLRTNELRFDKKRLLYEPNFSSTMKTNVSENLDNTQARIKQAARIIFLKKGLDGARTQEIADLAGANPALIPYYFKTKHKLFEIILVEEFAGIIARIEKIVNDQGTPFEIKVQKLVDVCSDMVLESPHLPIYSVSVIRKGNSAVINYTKHMRNMLHQSVMAGQLRQEVAAGTLKPIGVAHVLINLLGLAIFPALAAPILQIMGDMKEEDYAQLIKSRQQHVAEWVLQSLR
jgi:AcrR family transcriptional regulator